MIRTITFLLILLLTHFINAKPGDTTRVVTHNKVVIKTNPGAGNTKYYGWGTFPKTGTKYQKAFAELTFKCAPGLKCGEWDYLNYIYLCNRRGAENDSLGWEIMRFITPYGFYWDQNWNHTWVFDITDFAHLLHDSVQIMYQHTGYEANHDRGWEISLKFNLVEGTPWRDVKNITRFYTRSVGYGNDTLFDKNVPEDTFTLGEETDLMRFKILQTGHGMDKPENCAEFCPKRRYIVLDGAVADESWVWRDDCGENPVFPQAGTWLYDRAGWCPGAEVREYNLDIAATPGSTHRMDLDMESYKTTSGGANYMLSTYLVEYGKPNYNLDVVVEDIISPNAELRYKRVNPSCGSPKIIVRNRGGSAAQSIDFLYGMDGLQQKHYRWNGNLKPGQWDTLDLPPDFARNNSGGTFKVNVAWVNNRPDDNPSNNTATVFTGNLPPLLPNKFVLYCSTNSAPTENSWEIRDMFGKTVKARKKYPTANMVYRDTIDLPEGCYTLDFQDTGAANPNYMLNEDGLQWWANTADGNGFLQIRSLTNSILQRFGADFGSSIRFAFTVGKISDPAVPLAQISIRPNPAKDYLMLDFSSYKPEDLNDVCHIVIHDIRGRKVMEQNIDIHRNSMPGLNISALSTGIYHLKLTYKETVISQKLIKQ
ncbi:MAG: T9SS C-terminal target domain-containing protein [Bacteroidetes bacterium]|nr:T9SS C-terminal target domain-containing protein [Bacteroidota bacterium]